MAAWQDKLRKIAPYVPGEQPEDPTIIKLNTNENPYPPAPGVQKAVEQDGWLGVLGGGIKGTSVGIAAAIFFGMIFSVISKPKAK